MPNEVLVAAASLNSSALAFDENVNQIAKLLHQAAREQCQFVLFPELSISGYGCEDAFFYPWVQEESLAATVRLAKAFPEQAFLVGLPFSFEGILYNGMAFCAAGRIQGIVAKQNLANDGIHYEHRWFKPWPAGKKSTLLVEGKKTPVGDLIFSCSGFAFGMEICEDAWVQNRPTTRWVKKGLSLVLNPNASHFAFGKQKKRRALALKGAKLSGAVYLQANLLGNECGRVIYDGALTAATPAGKVYEGRRLSLGEGTLFLVNVPVRAFRGSAIAVRHQLERSSVKLTLPKKYDQTKEEEFLDFLTLALFDYLRKSGCQGYVVSLSGGRDSALCALGVRLLVERAFREGRFELLQAAITALKNCADIDAAMPHILTTVYQRAQFSSLQTENAAGDLARQIKATHYTVDVSSLVVAYQKLLPSALAQLGENSLALQNLQARVRAPSVWILANTENKLLLTTSNRSEGAVGYTTMDGDSAGCLAPLAGIDKDFISQFLAKLSTTSISGFGPFPVLKATLAMPPSAELKNNQSDEADLMPYRVLNEIERLLLVERLSPQQVVSKLKVIFGGEFSAEQSKTMVSKFCRLFTQNQWKRERIAPSFHGDTHNLDPRSWLRFPILSKGFPRV